MTDVQLQNKIDRAVARQERDRLNAAQKSLTHIGEPRGVVAVMNGIVRRSHDDRAKVCAAGVMVKIADWGRRINAQAAEPSTHIQINFPLPHPAQAVEPADIIDRGVVMVQSRRDGDGDGNGHGNT